MRLCRGCRKDHKWCPRCDAVKARAEFILGTGRVYGYCGVCRAGHNAAWDAANPDYHYAYHLQRKFGITPERAAELVAVDTCECCGETKVGKRLCVDHDHATGAIRGVVCHGCNLLIGAAENPDLPDAIRYLNDRR
jgi:hypothetical protein